MNIFLKDWAENSDLIGERILESGSCVVEIAFLYPFQIAKAKELNTSWYRSKERRGGAHPFASYMLNKKWTFEEEFNNHMMRFQQVTVCSSYFSKRHFDIPGWIVDH